MTPRGISWVDPSDYPQFDLLDIKQQLRIDHEEFDNLILNFHLPAAVQWAEGETHRAIVSRAHTWTLDEFPLDAPYAIRLPRGRTQSVESIVYRLDGVATTLTGPDASPIGTGWLQDLNNDAGGLLYPPTNSSWPTADIDQPDPVVVNFTAGYLTGEVPPVIWQAIMMHIADALDIVGSADFGPATNTQYKRDLLSAYRKVAFY